MAWWQLTFALFVISAIFTNAAQANHPQLVEGLVAEPKSTDNICFSEECIHAASWLRTNINSKVDPCDDFYKFACDNTKLTSIPGDRYIRNEDALADDTLTYRLKKIIESIDKTKVPKYFGLIKTLYNNCINSVPDPINIPYLAYIAIRAGLKSPNGWPVILGSRWRDPSNIDPITPHVLLQMVFKVDPKNPIRYVPCITHRDPGLSNDILRQGFDHYIVRAYYRYMVDIAVMLGATKAQAEIELNEALLLGISIANCALPSVKRSMINTDNYERATIRELAIKYMKLDLWVFVMSSSPRFHKFSKNDIIILEGDFQRLEAIVTNPDKRRALFNWLTWIALLPQLPTLGNLFRTRVQHFNDFLGTSAEESPKWKKCVKTVQSNLGLGLSALYQRKYMTPNILSDIFEIHTNIKQQFEKIVLQADWMDVESKREYLRKIDTMVGHIAYRDEYVDDEKIKDLYGRIELVEGTLRDSINNISKAMVNVTSHFFENRFNEDSWIETGNILEYLAVFSSYHNQFHIGSRSTLPNYYHIDRPKYMNYGTLGTIISREISHSFDTDGIYIDSESNLRQWLSSETKQAFDDSVKCLINQYGNYTVEEIGVKLNGDRLVRENMADSMGLQVAYNAYLDWVEENNAERALPGLSHTPTQMFWISVANVWCKMYNESTLRRLVAYDEYTPAKQRINGAFANRPEFANDFKCRLESKMNPVKKCSVF